MATRRKIKKPLRMQKRELENPPKRVEFRDAKGRIVSPLKRYDKKVDVYLKVRNKWRKITAKPRRLDPPTLAGMVQADVFRELPIIHTPVGSFKSRRKEAVWDIAGELDTTKGIRRQFLYAEIHLTDKKTGKKVVIEKLLPRIRANRSARSMIARALNDAITGEGKMIYDRVPGKILAERYGLDKAKLDKVIITKARK